jgi:hypothetical protein
VFWPTTILRDFDFYGWVGHVSTQHDFGAIVFGASEAHQLVEIGAVKLFVEDRAV